MPLIKTDQVMRLIVLQTLQRQLMGVKYDQLGLTHLYTLRAEVDREIAHLATAAEEDKDAS